MFILFMVFFLAALYGKISTDWIFMRLEDKYPTYYKKADMPSFVSLNLRRQGRANDLLLKAMFGSLPSDFPKDKEIRKRISILQSLFLFAVLPAWIGIIIMMFSNFGS